MFIVGGLMMGVICAFASKTIMENKGYTDTTTYILLGFFLGIIGVIIAATKPDLNVAGARLGTPVQTSTGNSNVEALKMYKELLDSGAITQEEFDEKKRQLLVL